MATAGSAIGLGSLWKFPYVTGENGGGLFVLAYLVFTFVIGVPIFIAELLIGRSAFKAPVGAFADLSGLRKNWRFVGWSCALVTFLISSYYSVVAGWALNYTFMSLLNFSSGKSPEQISNVFNLLYEAAGINLLWTFLFIGLTTAIVYRGIRKGIEFWAKILTPALLLILILLFIFSSTLTGFSEAFFFVFQPVAAKMKASGLLQALGLACFTLSVGMGILITYGSYMRKTDDIPKTAFTVASMDILVALLASLMIFPIIFTFGFSPEEGPGLLFKTLPVLFNELPGTILISTTFFLLVVFAALTSAISVMEVMVATVTESFGWSRERGTLIVGCGTFILAIPSALSGSQGIFKNWPAMYGKTFFETIDFFSFTWLLPLNAILTALFAGWVIDKMLRRAGFLEGSSWLWLFKPWLFLVRWIVPIAVVLIMLEQSGILDIDLLFQRLKWVR
ncbi:MAG: sodium-dependent transporter [Chlamydiales bacterium]|nr:sodium-dependent transporter [Chlamydiales bacterium]